MKAQNLKYWVAMIEVAGFVLTSSNAFALMSCLGGICGAKRTVAHDPNTHLTSHEQTQSGNNLTPPYRKNTAAHHMSAQDIC
jgi:hypothetical protein